MGFVLYSTVWPHFGTEVPIGKARQESAAISARSARRFVQGSGILVPPPAVPLLEAQLFCRATGIAESTRKPLTTEKKAHSLTMEEQMTAFFRALVDDEGLRNSLVQGKKGDQTSINGKRVEAALINRLEFARFQVSRACSSELSSSTRKRRNGLPMMCIKS